MAYFSRKNSSINPYSVGDRIYGGGRSFPTIGPVDKMGYKERDRKTVARRNAMLRRMQANQSGKVMSSDSMRKV